MGKTSLGYVLGCVIISGQPYTNMYTAKQIGERF